MKVQQSELDLYWSKLWHKHKSRKSVEAAHQMLALHTYISKHGDMEERRSNVTNLARLATGSATKSVSLFECNKSQLHGSMTSEDLAMHPIVKDWA